MNLKDILLPSAVLATVKVEDKKQLLAELSEVASGLTGLRSRDIHQALLQRENLGSTGIGRGIAIPHGRLSGLTKIHCVFARLDKPIAFDSVDAEPVDLVCVLLTPEHAGGDHLKALARISRLLRDTKTAEMLRATRSAATLHLILTDQGELKKAG